MGRSAREGGVVFNGPAKVRDVAGRDMHKTTRDGVLGEKRLRAILRPVEEVVDQAPASSRAAAAELVAALRQELAKPQGGSPGAVRKIVEGILGLVPAAVAAVTSAFASPILAASAGAATQPVLEWLKGRR